MARPRSSPLASSPSSGWTVITTTTSLIYGAPRPRARSNISSRTTLIDCSLLRTSERADGSEYDSTASLTWTSLRCCSKTRTDASRQSDNCHYWTPLATELYVVSSTAATHTAHRPRTAKWRGSITNPYSRWAAAVKSRKNPSGASISPPHVSQTKWPCVSVAR